MTNDPNWRGVGKGPRIPVYHGSMMYSESGADHAHRILSELEAALDRPDGSTMLDVHLFCPNSDCCVGRFSLTLTNQRYLEGYKIVHTFACPYCGKFAVLDAYMHPPIETTREYNQRQERDARRSVWRQAKRRRTGNPGIWASDVYEEIDIEKVADLVNDE